MPSQEQVFDYGVLHIETHGSLVKNMGKISIATGVPQKYIYTKDEKGICSDFENDWIKKSRQYRDDGIGGLILTGTEFDHSPEEKMMVMGGKLIRNFIDARLVIVQELLEEMKDGNPDASDVLLIPNFFIAKAGKSIPDWQVNLLQGLLIKRLCQRNITILYVQDMEKLKNSYGLSLFKHLQSNYTIYQESI